MTPSWRLKFGRAQKHIKEFETQIARYAKRYPYRGDRVPSRDRRANPHLWTYVLRISQQPREEVALSYGDALHNLRSSLDHLAVALVPSDRKSHARFLCLTDDPWRLRTDGEFVFDDEYRMSFEQAVRGMPPEAIAFILRMQPYGRAAPEEEALAVLNRLDVADKHRRLIAFISGLEEPTTTLRIRGTPVPYATTQGGLTKDGAELFTVDVTPWPGLKDAEVEVHVRGTPVVGIQVSEEAGHVDAMEAFQTISSVVDYILKTLEPFVWRTPGRHETPPEHRSQRLALLWRIRPDNRVVALLPVLYVLDVPGLVDTDENVATRFQAPDIAGTDSRRGWTWLARRRIVWRWMLRSVSSATPPIPAERCQQHHGDGPEHGSDQPQHNARPVGLEDGEAADHQGDDEAAPDGGVCLARHVAGLFHASVSVAFARPDSIPSSPVRG